MHDNCAVVEYQATPGPTRPGASTSLDPTPLVVVVLDTNTEHATLQALQAALPAALEAGSPSHTQVAVLGCDGVVTLWHTARWGQGGPLTATTLPGTRALDESAVQRVDSECDRYWLPLPTALSTGALAGVLAAMRPLYPTAPAHQQPRCLGVAMEAGIRVAAAWARRVCAGRPVMATTGPVLPAGSRLLVLTSGPITAGPGAVPQSVLDHLGGPQAAMTRVVEASRQHMDTLATMASLLRLPIDVLSVGVPSVNVALLSALADGTGGALTAHAGRSPLLRDALLVTLTRTWGRQAVLDCYASKGIRLAEWQGAVMPLPAAAHKAAQGEVSKAAVCVSSLSTGHGIVARMEQTADLTGQDTVFVQVVMGYNDDRGGGRITRVLTQRLHVVSTIAEMLRGLDPVAAAVAVCKHVVDSAVVAGAHRLAPALNATRTACAAAVTLLASRFGKVHVSGGLLGFGTRSEHHVPAAVTPVIAALYHVQRSALLRLPQTAVHPETRLFLMRTLLTASLPVAAAVVSPALYMVQLQRALAPGPPQSQSSSETHAQSTTPARLLPLPSLDLVLAAARQAADVQHGGHSTASPDASTLQGLINTLILDVGSRLVAWPLPAGSSAPGAALQAVASALQGIGPAGAGLLGRGAVPDLVLGDGPTGSHLLVPVHRDTAAQQLGQLGEACFSAALMQQQRTPDSFATTPSQVSAALPLLHSLMVQLANAGWTPEASTIDCSGRAASSRADSRHAGDTAREEDSDRVTPQRLSTASASGVIQPLGKPLPPEPSLVQWCAELSVRLPGT